jgi:hypothetical protein
MPGAHDLDFWLDQWDISWGDGLTATNTIESVLDGAVIRETFDGRPGADFQGNSWSVYSPQLGYWRQTWVDSQGSYWAFSGGLEGERVILATDEVRDGKPIKLRMVFYNIAADSLDWDWERSDDGGATWALQWRLHYTRKLKAGNA